MYPKTSLKIETKWQTAVVKSLPKGYFQKSYTKS